jgi:hypothetical protein
LIIGGPKRQVKVRLRQRKPAQPAEEVVACEAVNSSCPFLDSLWTDVIYTARLGATDFPLALGLEMQTPAGSWVAIDELTIPRPPEPGAE